MAQLVKDVLFATAVYAAFGLVLGSIAFVTGQWAQTQFITNASGQAPTEFGPVFIAVIFVQTAASILLFGPVIAVFVGRLIGSAFDSPATALVSGAAGGLFGSYVMAAVAIGLLTLSKGDAANQAFTLRQAIRPILLAGIPTAIVGGVAAAVESILS